MLRGIPDLTDTILSQDHRKHVLEQAKWFLVEPKHLDKLVDDSEVTQDVSWFQIELIATRDVVNELAFSDDGEHWRFKL